MSTRKLNQVNAKLTQGQRTDISDQRMFDATVSLVVQHGTAGTSLKEVGLLAGYSRGLASHRFGSKDSLFSFTLRKLGVLWLKQLKMATGSKVGIAAFEQALEQHYQFCVDAPDYVRTFYTLWFESVNGEGELCAAIKKIHQRRQVDVEQWITDDPNISANVKQRASTIASQFGASVIGIIYFWLSNQDDLGEIKKLHEGLQETMVELLQPHTSAIELGIKKSVN